jgi:gliding motility-associated-like protein
MKRRFKEIAIVCSLALGAGLHAQQIGSITPAVIGSSGNYSVNGNISISSTTGECIVPTVQNGPIILTQGFQQPSANGTLSLNSTLVYYNATCLGANDGTASMTVSGGSAPYTYIWSSRTGDTLATNDSLVPGTYTVTVVDAGNLSQSHTFTIVDGTDICGIHVYSGFTPNNDGRNDLFRAIVPSDCNVKSFAFSIFNRWGQEVFSTNKPNTGWDGRLDGTPAEMGTYSYMVRYYIDNSRKVNMLKGNFILMR